MSTLDELKEEVTASGLRVALLEGKLPAFIKTLAKSRHVVHPFLELADEYPDVPHLREYAAERLVLSEKQTALQVERLKTAEPPDLRLSRVKRWSDE